MGPGLVFTQIPPSGGGRRVIINKIDINYESPCFFKVG